jgi:hypothetical protein
MNETYGPPRWVPWVVGLALTVVAATVAYNTGLSQGLAEQGTEAAPVVYRHWHGLGPVWLLFGFFWFFAIFRGGYWGWGGPRYWRYSRRYRFADDEVPPEFEYWYRRMHEKEKGEPPRPSNS